MCNKVYIPSLILNLMAKNSPQRVLLHALIGIVIILISFGILNLVSNNLGNPQLETLTSFFNSNLLFLLGILIAMFLGELFASFTIPLNTLYPIFYAISSVLVVELIFRLLGLIDSLLELQIFKIFKPFYLLFVILVFAIVLIVGYFQIISGLGSKKKKPRRKKVIEEDVNE
jgi:hypothetical protein